MTTLVSAVLAGVAVLLGGNLPWIALLAPWNLRFFQDCAVGDHPDGDLPRHVLALHGRPDGIKPEPHARRENLRANPGQPTRFSPRWCFTSVAMSGH
jgi:hypothetical protein